MFALAQAYNACQECYDNSLFQAFLANLIDKKPNVIDTKNILSDTFTYFQKHCDLWGDIQWENACNEARTIEHKYDNTESKQMAVDMLVQIMDILEKRFKGVQA